MEQQIMSNELYIIGDQSRMVVKNLILQLIKTDCRLNVYPPMIDEIDKLPGESIKLLVLLSDNIEFLIIKKIASLQAQYDLLRFGYKLFLQELGDN